MNYFGLAVVLLLLWPSAVFVRRTWREGKNRPGALGVAAYAGLALALAVYQLVLRP